MCFAMPRVFFIKVLTDLDLTWAGTYFYRHVGPTDLKRPRLTMASAGETRSDARVASEGPRATGKSRPGGLSYREETEI